MATDNSVLLPNSHGLPADLLYNVKPSMVRGRAYRASIMPSNMGTSFAAGALAIHYVPCRRNCFLDPQQSYMRITIQNTDSTASLNVDTSAYSFFNMIQIFHGSNLLETIQNFDALSAYIVDFQYDTAQKTGMQQILGCSSTRQGITINPSEYYTFCLPVLSGVIGTGLDKYLPLSLADDIRVETTLNSTQLAGCWSTTPTGSYSVVNMELELTILELSDVGMELINEVTPFSRDIFMHGVSWRHFSGTVTSGTTGFQTYLVPMRFASAKKVVVLPRRSTELTAYNAYSVGSRLNPNIDSYHFRLGSLIVPPRDITIRNNNTTGGPGEAYAEILKSWHSFTSVLAPSVSQAQYAIWDNSGIYQYGGQSGGSLTTSSYNNAFAIAQELETVYGRSDVLLSGCNLLNVQSFFEFTNTYGPSANYTLDFYVQYDHILILDTNGLLSVKF